MKTTSKALAAFVALEHLLFLVMETFLWQTKFVMERFQMSAEKAEMTLSLAQNQGVYNGFLAAGLIWSLFIGDPRQARQTRIFFLVCVVIAGIVGAITAKTSILFIQGLPGLLGLVVTFLAKEEPAKVDHYEL
jgi:putative membrane protein